MARAAEELSVSPSAVSHQIKIIESWFGHSLFARDGRELVLNTHGRQFYDLVRPAFEQLRMATHRLIDPPNGRVKVLLCPSLASTWLAPRMANFFEKNVEIDIDLHCRRETVDLNETDFDCALRYCAGVPENHVGVSLMNESVFPVCSPALMEQGQIKSLEDLKDQRLLNDVLGETGVTACNWSNWFSEIGMPQLVAGRGCGFSDSNIMYEAACRGVGVALGRSVLVDDLLQSKRLVRPFDITRRSNYAWHFLTTSHKQDKAPLVAFKEWLVSEADISNGLARGTDL